MVTVCLHWLCLHCSPLVQNGKAFLPDQSVLHQALFNETDTTLQDPQPCQPFYASASVPPNLCSPVVQSLAWRGAAAVHEELLQSYLAGWQGLAEVLDDGYFMQNVGHHLATAKRFRDLKTLLTNAAWLESKLHSYGVASVVADYRRCDSHPSTISLWLQNCRETQHAC